MSRGELPRVTNIDGISDIERIDTVGEDVVEEYELNSQLEKSLSHALSMQELTSLNILGKTILFYQRANMRSLFHEQCQW